MRSLGCLWQIKHVSWGSDAAPVRELEQQSLCQLHFSVSLAAAGGGTLQFCAPEQTRTQENQCWSHCSLGKSLEITSIFICKILEVFPFKHCKHMHFRKVCVCFLLPDPARPDPGIPRNLQITLVKTTASDQFPGQPDKLGELCCL